MIPILDAHENQSTVPHFLSRTISALRFPVREYNGRMFGIGCANLRSPIESNRRDSTGFSVVANKWTEITIRGQAGESTYVEMDQKVTTRRKQYGVSCSPSISLVGPLGSIDGGGFVPWQVASKGCPVSFLIEP